MREIVAIPQFGRTELLYCCLRRVREFEPNIPVHVFPDRGTANDEEVLKICQEFNAKIEFVPKHDYYGNSYNVMEIYRWAYNGGYDLLHMLESDVFVHSDYFSWHRETQERFPDIFASMAWVFNRHAPISNDPMFQPWFYSPGVAVSRKSLALIAPHATPLYYNDMRGYIAKNFKENPLNDPENIMHLEQDGILQRILMQHNLQTVSCGVAKCSHMGFVRSYGDTGALPFYEELLDYAHLDFMQRVARVEELYNDHYWRANTFGRAITEREIGHELKKRQLRYKVQLEDGWSCDFVSELQQRHLPRRLFSVPLPPSAKFVLL